MRNIVTCMAICCIIFSFSAHAQQAAPMPGMMPGMFKKLVHFNNPQKEACTLTIVDSAGATIKTYKNITADTMTLDLRELNKGRYTYTVTNASGTELKHGMVMGRHMETKTEIDPRKDSKKN